MSVFGETLFGGSSFVRRALSPFLILFAIVIPLFVPRWSPTAALVVVSIDLACVALLLGFWAPTRISRPAYRVVAAIVGLFYAGYLVGELAWGHDRLRMAGSRAEPSLRNACLAFVAIGVPCLWYAVFGRFRDPPIRPHRNF